MAHKRLIFRCHECEAEFIGPNLDGMRCYLCDGAASPVREAMDADYIRFNALVKAARGRELALRGGENDE